MGDKSEKQKMLDGEPYLASDPELVQDRNRARKWTRWFNQTTENEEQERTRILRELFGSTGETMEVEPFFQCDYGYNIHVGDGFFVNFNAVFLDVNEISIGRNAFLGPNVQLYTAYHPIDPVLRNSGKEMGKPITIGNNVWIGGGAIINPGVVIEDNVVIGSGSVVTRDIPSDVVACGNPCRPIKRVTDSL